MRTDDFCYWLQGYAELCGERPSEIQWDMIKEHLQLVFKKETKLNVNMNYCGNLKFDGVDYPSEYVIPQVTGIEEFQKYNFSGFRYKTGEVNVPPLDLNQTIITC